MSYLLLGRLTTKVSWMTVLEAEVTLMCFTTRALAFLAAAGVESTADFNALSVVCPETVSILLRFLFGFQRSSGWRRSFRFDFGHMRNIGHQMLAHDARAVEGETASGEMLVDGSGNLAVIGQVALDFITPKIDCVARKFYILLPVLARERGVLAHSHAVAVIPRFARIEVHGIMRYE